MTNLTRLEFTALEVSGRNHLTWVLDAKLHLASNNLGDTIKEKNSATPQSRAKAMILPRHHLHESLKAQYLTVEDPYELWESLKGRFDHQRTAILPRARYEWMHLRLQDFSKVADYNSEMFRIVSTLKLCGEKITDEDMLEKTFSTFHADNMLLQQQYRERGFKTHSELISCLIVAEENNQLLLKNHETRPTGSAPPPAETNATSSRGDRGRGRGRGPQRGRGYGRGRARGRGRPNYGSGRYSNARSGNENETKNKNPQKRPRSTCYRCGKEGHWANVCRAPTHIADEYQKSQKKGKQILLNLKIILISMLLISSYSLVIKRWRIPKKRILIWIMMTPFTSSPP